MRERGIQRKEKGKFCEQKLSEEMLRRKELKNKNIKQERKEILKNERAKHERIKEENENERNIRINENNNSPHMKNNNNYLKYKKNKLNENFGRIKINNSFYNSINDNKRIDNLNRRKNKSFHENKNILNKPSFSLKNSNKDKFICPLRIQQKTAILNFPNQNKNVYIYGESKENEKYKRIYTNVEKVNDGRIENYVETGISKDGQFLISVTSSQKIYDEYYNENDENEEIEEEPIEGGIKYDREEDNDNIYELPYKKVEEIISNVTIKKKNLGDNYKFFESKYLNKPNISSSTKHRRRNERSIFLNEEYKTREKKEYKIRSHFNEYDGETQQIIETSKEPYEEKRIICGQGYKDGKSKEMRINEYEADSY